jgi:hypothetical protein
MAGGAEQILHVRERGFARGTSGETKAWLNNGVLSAAKHATAGLTLGHSFILPRLHQRLDALAELLHTDQEVVEGQHDALGGG